MRRADPLVERLLPEVVDTLREAAAAARAAEQELAQNVTGDAIEFLLDQQLALQSALTMLRVLKLAREVAAQRDAREAQFQ